MTLYRYLLLTVEGVHYQSEWTSLTPEVIYANPRIIGGVGDSAVQYESKELELT